VSKVIISTRIAAPADDVWKLIGGFNGLPDWHPAVEKSETDGDGEGSVRKLALAGGGTIVERLERVEDDERQYTYSITDSPLPVSNYVATIRVRDDGDGTASLVEWSSEFQPAGVSESDAVKVIQGIYSAGGRKFEENFRRLRATTAWTRRAGQTDRRQ